MQNEKEIRYIDLFGGVGGFRLGIERATTIGKKQIQIQRDKGCNQETSNIENNSKPIVCKTKCVFYNDIDKYAVQTYNKNFKENYEATDIRTIKTDSIPDFDMLCGGFPCQAFSIAGKRRGFQDTRGTLFFEIARIIKAKRPKIVFLENVKGLLNHNKGQTFSIIIQTLSELGYDVQWMVLNSKFFGVPQNRERVFIIGSFRGTTRPEILPFGESSEEFNKRNPETESASSLQSPGHACGNYRGMNMISKTIRKGGRGSIDNKHNWDIISIPVLTPDRENKRQYGRRFKNDGEPSFTLTGQDIHGVMVMNTIQEAVGTRAGSSASFKKSVKNINESIGQIRRLTPIECERLQGFPDNWTNVSYTIHKSSINGNHNIHKGIIKKQMSDTQRYKQMGNAVTVNVIQAIIERLLK